MTREMHLAHAADTRALETTELAEVQRQIDRAPRLIERHAEIAESGETRTNESSTPRILALDARQERGLPIRRRFEQARDELIDRIGCRQRIEDADIRDAGRSFVTRVRPGSRPATVPARRLSRLRHRPNA
jgi:hypothetical protein